MMTKQQPKDAFQFVSKDGNRFSSQLLFERILLGSDSFLPCYMHPQEIAFLTLLEELRAHPCPFRTCKYFVRFKQGCTEFQ